MSETEDFAALFASSLHAKPLTRGQSVQGVVVRIGPEVALVDVGGKSEAVIDIAELKSPEGALEVAVGDRIDATVVSTSGGITLSRTLARRAATDRQIAQAFEVGLPVEGRVQAVVKGGYEVRVGHSRAFCPLSQIDSVRTADPTVHVGRIYPFHIVEYGESGRNLVLSRRKLLEQEQQARAAEIRQAIVPGAVRQGRVVSVREYGAFVDLGGGVQGLLHASEMGWSHVADPSEAVAAGEEITVTVLRVDEDRQKIALSRKQLTTDPWVSAADRYRVGQVHPGRITRIAEFGAFVELEPGIEALAHVSTFPPTAKRDDWMRDVPVGMTAAFEILSIDPNTRRIGVALVPEGSMRAAGASAGQIVPGARLRGRVERHERFGMFVYLAPGQLGLMPMSETGVDKDGELARQFPVGSEVDVIVLDIDETGRRIRVSRQAVLNADDAAALRDYAARSEEPPSRGLGSLADKLRGALRHD
jgi:small subunit ribosomal protein S1